MTDVDPATRMVQAAYRVGLTDKAGVAPSAADGANAAISSAQSLIVVVGWLSHISATLDRIADLSARRDAKSRCP